ncbi:uncharacterized protein LOC120342024 [Styela clava]
MKTTSVMTQFLVCMLLYGLILQCQSSKISKEQIKLEQFKNEDNTFHLMEKRSTNSDIETLEDSEEHRTKRSLNSFWRYICSKKPCLRKCREYRRPLARPYRGKNRLVKCCKRGILQMNYCRLYEMVM